MTLGEYKQTDMQCELGGYFSFFGNGTLKSTIEHEEVSVEIDTTNFEKLTTVDYGMSESVTTSNTSLLSGAILDTNLHQTAQGGSLDRTVTRFILNIEDAADHFMWMEFGAAKSAVTTIENAPAASVVLYVTPAGSVNVMRFGIGKLAISPEEFAEAGIDMSANDVLTEVAFQLEDPAAERTNAYIKLTFTDVAADKTITRTAMLGEYKVADLQREIGGYFSYYGAGTLTAVGIEKDDEQSGDLVDFREFGFTANWKKELGLK